MFRTPLGILSTLVLATAAHAVDGVLEINQTCAERTGCFAGDAPGFPVSITGRAMHSVRLTSDLDVDSSIDAILVETDDVSIDLNGFRISGISTCKGHDGVCNPQGDGSGVARAAGTIPERTEVRNGSIVGMGGDGVDLGTGSVAVGLRTARNGGYGIRVGATSRVEGCVSRENYGTGVSTGSSSSIVAVISSANGGSGMSISYDSVVSGATVSHNEGAGIGIAGAGTVQGSTIEANAGYGILANGVYPATNIRDNTVRSNGGYGIAVGDGGNVTGNSVVANGFDGIIAQDGSVIIGNSLYENGTGSGHDGIRCSLGCTVQNNAVRSSTGYGLRFSSSSSAYSGNSISANAQGTVVGGTDAGGNVCQGALGCP